jgi:hypothetical protein
VGEGLVVVDGRVTKVAVNSVNGRSWQVRGEGFSLEFIPEALSEGLDGSFTARAGSKVAVRGDGFLAGSLVATYLPGALADSLGQSTVEADGSFAVEATIPATLGTGTYVFQVNGLGTATSVRSVNLGMRLLPTLRIATKTPSLRVSFTPGQATISASGAKSLSVFTRRHAKTADSVLIVPLVGVRASSRDVILARARAQEVKNALRKSGFRDPISIVSTVKRSAQVIGGSRTTVWMRTNARVM